MHVAVIGRKLILFLPLSDHFFFYFDFAASVVNEQPRKLKIDF